MIGDGQQARIRAERGCSRRRDTPETPGEAWGPTCSVTRRSGTEAPRGVLPRRARAGAEVSTADATGGGWRQKPTPRGTPVDRRTCARTWGSQRGESAWSSDEPGERADVAMAYHPLADECAAGVSAPTAHLASRAAWGSPPSPQAADPPPTFPRGHAPGGATGDPRPPGPEAPGRGWHRGAHASGTAFPGGAPAARRERRARASGLQADTRHTRATPVGHAHRRRSGHAGFGHRGAGAGRGSAVRTQERWRSPGTSHLGGARRERCPDQPATDRGAGGGQRPRL